MSVDTRAYLDHAATTPVRPEVAEALAALPDRLANPSSLHASGRAARALVEDARDSLAEHLGADPSEVLLTAGGTEADNLAVLGLYRARRRADPARDTIVLSAVEHHAVLEPAHWLAREENARVRELPVDATGRVPGDALVAAVDADPERLALISLMWANNEVGTAQPVSLAAVRGAAVGVPVHADAAQAVGSMRVDFTESGLSAMTVSGHKIGAPVGCGALLVRTEVALSPVLHGGGQERRVRSGTVDVRAAVGLATAVRLAVVEREQHVRRLETLRAELLDGVLAQVPDAVPNGTAEPGARLPGVLNLSFPGCAADALLMLLDAAGVDSSTGSACTSGVPETSHVLLAMGRSEREARSALRFSLGRTSTSADVARVVGAVADAVRRARAAEQATGRRP